MLILPKPLDLRPCCEADTAFLRRLYGTTRQAELDLLDWPEDQKLGFVHMQFAAQHQYYHDQYPNCHFWILEQDGNSIGRLYLDEREDEFRIVDIALLPDFCGQGFGSKILGQIQGLAQSKGKKVTIHVEHNNPAQRLYQRLGFKKAGEVGIYHFMAWQPQ
ncbi:MAG: GNAT family N-acetyltransferase [Acidobacteria bacterium]|nr:GNAT family N-acetyltransferase [Acidobacteriota bacterium]MCB9398747.1 GNAT family N-acetyltransferase [Acidobacteriota bacterium]